MPRRSRGRWEWRVDGSPRREGEEAQGASIYKTAAFHYVFGINMSNAPATDRCVDFGKIRMNYNSNDILPRPRGRPKVFSDADRRDILITVAHDIFCEVGYEKTTMESVASRARVSKPTLYRLFENKKSLFAAVLDHHRQETAVLPVPDDMPLAEALARILRVDLDSDAFLKQMRIVEMGIAEEVHNPDLREVMRNHGADPTSKAFATWLSLQMDRGQLRRAGDPRMLAGVLLGLVFVTSHFPGAGSEEVDRPALVRLCVDLFLHGLTPRASKAGEEL